MSDSNQIILFCFLSLLVVFGYCLKKLRPNYFNRFNSFFGTHLQPNKLGRSRGYEGNRSWIWKKLAVLISILIGILLLHVILSQ